MSIIRYCKDCQRSCEFTQTTNVTGGVTIVYSKCSICGKETKISSKPNYNYENKPL